MKQGSYFIVEWLRAGWGQFHQNLPWNFIRSCVFAAILTVWWTWTLEIGWLWIDCLKAPFRYVSPRNQSINTFKTLWLALLMLRVRLCFEILPCRDASKKRYLKIFQPDLNSFFLPKPKISLSPKKLCYDQIRGFERTLRLIPYLTFGGCWGIWEYLKFPYISKIWNKPYISLRPLKPLQLLWEFQQP